MSALPIFTVFPDKLPVRRDLMSGLSGAAKLKSYFFLFCHFSKVTRRGEPKKIDEYVPAAIPTIRARENAL